MKFDFTTSKVSFDGIDVVKGSEKDLETLAKKSIPMTNWTSLPVDMDNDVLEKIKIEANELRKDNEACVLIGIGGSYLGAKALYDLFYDRHDNIEFYFAGWNMSSKYHLDILDRLKGKNFCVIVVSKSGSTTETRAAFELFKGVLKERFGSEYNKHIVAISEVGSKLNREAEENGYKYYPMDPNVGGRYSVLSYAGLVPCAVMGLDIDKIVTGSRCASDDIYLGRNTDVFSYAYARRVLAKSKTNEIYCFTEPSMEFFGQWLVQLFGESEGKSLKGLMPSCLVFTRDLHSMGQFLQEGSKVFFETILTFDSVGEDLSFNEDEPSFTKYNSIIADAVVQAHSDNPVIRVNSEKLDEITIGYYIYFFEMACALSVMLMGEDPFNQPGVEVYKQNVRNMTAMLKENK